MVRSQCLHPSSTEDAAPRPRALSKLNHVPTRLHQQKTTSLVKAWRTSFAKQKDPTSLAQKHPTSLAQKDKLASSLLNPWTHMPNRNTKTPSLNSPTNSSKSSDRPIQDLEDEKKRAQDATRNCARRRPTHALRGQHTTFLARQSHL